MRQNEIEEPLASDAGFASSVEEIPASSRRAANSTWHAHQRSGQTMVRQQTKVRARIASWVLLVVLTVTGVALLVTAFLIWPS